MASINSWNYVSYWDKEEKFFVPSSKSGNCKLKECDINFELFRKFHTNSCTSEDLLVLMNENEFIVSDSITHLEYNLDNNSKVWIIEK